MVSPFLFKAIYKPVAERSLIKGLSSYLIIKGTFLLIKPPI
jgi:hypothetical protein